MMNSLLKKTALVVILLMVNMSAFAYVIDGVLTSADEYTTSYVFTMTLENPNAQDYEREKKDTGLFEKDDDGNIKYALDRDGNIKYDKHDNPKPLMAFKLDGEGNKIAKGHHLDADMDNFEGTIRLGWESTDVNNRGDLFLMFMLPTEVQDFTYGENASEGYRTGYNSTDTEHNIRDKAEYDKVQGSEYFSFTLDNDVIKVGMDDNGTGDDRIGHDVKGDTAGFIKNVSTSLTWNLVNYLEDYPQFFEKGAASPSCGTDDVQNDANATWQEKDQNCYDNPSLLDWEYQQIYELQLDGQYFSDAGIIDLLNVVALIQNINVHASDPKRGGQHGFNIGCLEGVIIMCEQSDTVLATSSLTVPVASSNVVSEPSLIVLLGLSLTGLAYRRKKLVIA